MATENMFRLAEVIPEDHIVAELEATEKEDAIRELVAKLVSAKAVPKSKAKAVIEQALEREGLGTTGIGRGIAVPHVKVPFVKTPIGALGRCPGGIDFSSLDGSPTHSVFMFVSPSEAPEKHVQLMSRFVELIRQGDFVSFLKQTEGSASLHDFLVEVDEW